MNWKRHQPLKYITIHIDGEAYKIIDRKYYDHIEWTYQKDERGFLLINPYEFAAWLKANSRKIETAPVEIVAA